MRYSGTNEVWTVAWGTNILKVLKLTDEQQALYGVVPTGQAWQIGLQPNGTNGFLVMLAPDQKTDATTAQKLHVNLINLSPVGGFFVALQVALYGGMLWPRRSFSILWPGSSSRSAHEGEVLRLSRAGFWAGPFSFSGCVSVISYSCRRRCPLRPYIPTGSDSNPTNGARRITSVSSAIHVGHGSGVPDAGGVADLVKIGVLSTRCYPRCAAT